jgi:hypothetical protein
MTETETTADLRGIDPNDPKGLTANQLIDGLLVNSGIEPFDRRRVDRARELRAELLRRLQCPDALREKVMAAFADLPDYWDRENYQTLVHVTRDDLTAAVGAALELSDE